MECTIHWVPGSGMGFVAETGSGHLLTMDGAPDGGGRNLAPRPMETLLAGAGPQADPEADQQTRPPERSAQKPAPQWNDSVINAPSPAGQSPSMSKCRSR